MTSQTEMFLQTLHPASAAAVVLALAGGTPLHADRLPVDALPAVVLLATCGLRVYEQQIIDDYPALLRRMEHIMSQSDVTRTVQLQYENPLCGDKCEYYCAVHQPDAGQRYDHVWMHLVVSIIMDGPRAPYFLDVMPEAAALPHIYEELVNGDLETLISNLAVVQAKPQRKRK